MTGSRFRALGAAATRFHPWGTSSAGVYNNGGFTQTFGASEVSQTNPNLGLYLQDEWKLTPRITLNLGLRYDLQFLETINTDTNDVSPRVGVAWSPFDSRRTLIRGSAGLFFDRVPLACARQRAAVRRQHDRPRQPPSDRRESVADAGRGAVISERPFGRCPVGHARQPDDDGSRSSECLFAASERRSGTAARGARDDRRGLPVSARAEPAHVDQSERADLRRVRHEQWLPAESGLRQQQPVSRPLGNRTITACTCRSRSDRQRGDTIGSHTPCRSR